MIFIIVFFAVALAIVGIVALVMLLRDTESWVSRKVHQRPGASGDDALVESEAMENQRSNDDGSVDPD